MRGHLGSVSVFLSLAVNVRIWHGFFLLDQLCQFSIWQGLSKYQILYPALHLDLDLSEPVSRIPDDPGPVQLQVFGSRLPEMHVKTANNPCDRNVYLRVRQAA
jgi:hypothetical protein